MIKKIVIIVLAAIVAFLLFTRRTSGFTEGIPIRQNDPDTEPYVRGCNSSQYTHVGDYCMRCLGKGRLDTNLKKCLRCPDTHPVERNMKCYITTADAKNFDPIKKCKRGKWNWKKARYNEDCHWE